MRRKMLPEEKALREAIDVHTVPHSAKPITRLIPALVRAVREDDAKGCDEQAAFYRDLKKKGPGGLVDADVARAMAAEDCAAQIRARR